MNRSDSTAPAGVPKWIFAVIIVILAAMYVYAAYWDRPEAEKTVDTFYQAYFTRDFPTVAENLSVFWSVNFLPQYGGLDKNDLLERRDEVEKATADMLANIESGQSAPENIKLNILSDYTKEGENSALVIYEFKEDNKVLGMEAALLIRENGKFRIFTMTPVDPLTLQQLKDVDISVLDKNFSQLVGD